MVAIKGNTFPVKDQLKALGGRWDGAAKCRMVPPAAEAQAKALVGSTGAAKATVRRSPRTCKTCGQKINYGVYCGKCEYA